MLFSLQFYIPVWCCVDELALVTLQESYSLLVLMYAVSKLSLRRRQIDKLNVSWNNVIHRLLN